MSNIHRLKRDDDEDRDDKDEYYAGGINNRGGGSGVAVTGNPGDENVFSKIVNVARSHTSRTPDVDAVKTKVKITLYKNGFRIDEGELRSSEDAAGKLFLAQLAEGYVPRELMESLVPPGSAAAAAAEPPKVSIEVDDRRSETYVPPSYVKFGGVGNALGADSAASSSGDDVVDPASPVIAALPAPPAVDKSQPSTTLQIRLLNGKKVRVQMNNAHTVAHLVGHIQTAIAANGGGSVRYVLSAGYPPVDVSLADMQQRTVEEAKLVNAAVILKPAV